jgi:hypothetical protein
MVQPPGKPVLAFAMPGDQLEIYESKHALVQVGRSINQKRSIVLNHHLLDLGNRPCRSHFFRLQTYVVHISVPAWRDRAYSFGWPSADRELYRHYVSSFFLLPRLEN